MQRPYYSHISVVFPLITAFYLQIFIVSLWNVLYQVLCQGGRVMRGGSSPPTASSSQSAQQRTPSFRLLASHLLDVSVWISVVSSFLVVVCPLGVPRRPLLCVKVKAFSQVCMRVKKKRVVLVLTCLFAPVAYRDYAPFFGVHRSWLSLLPSLWPLIYWSHGGCVGFSWRRCALWTPAHPWRSSAAVPCTARLCSPPAAIRMLVAFHGQTPQD